MDNKNKEWRIKAYEEKKEEYKKLLAEKKIDGAVYHDLVKKISKKYLSGI